MEGISKLSVVISAIAKTPLDIGGKRLVVFIQQGFIFGCSKSNRDTVEIPRVFTLVIPAKCKYRIKASITYTYTHI